MQKYMKTQQQDLEREELQLEIIQSEYPGTNKKRQEGNLQTPIMDQVTDLALRLMKINSIADNPQGLKDVLSLAGQELERDFAMELFEKNGIPSLLVSNTPRPVRNFKLLLNAHLDVVPGAVEQFQPYEKNGRLYGRGSYDMKSAAAAMIVLFRETAKLCDFPVGLQLVTDEEVFSTNTTQHQINQGVRADFVVTGENSDLKIKHMAKGIFWFKLKARGQTAHGGYPWLGDNALWRLLKALEGLKKHYPLPKGPVWATTLNLAKVETNNTTFNKVPDEATAYIDMRYVPQEKEKIEEKVKKLLPPDIELEVMYTAHVHYTDPANPYLKHLERQIQTVTGKKAQLQAAHATSDIRFYNAVGCDGVEFGPKGKNQHADNEWVDLASLEDYYHILKKFLLSLNK